jgi:hypothetical protein
MSPILRIDNIVKKVCLLINNSKVFNIKLHYIIKYTYDQSVYIKLYFDNDNFVTTKFYNNSSNYLFANNKNVNSTFGNYTGTLLFNIQMLIVSLSNTQQIHLDNYTDNPDRAARGIYSLLNVDKRMEDRNEFKNKDLKEQLLISEGKMYLNIDQSTIKLVYNKFIDINYKLDKTHKNSILNKNYLSNIKQFIKNIKYYY